MVPRESEGSTLFNQHLLGYGLVFRLTTLTDGEKLTALAAQADSRALRLPAGALNYLLARAPRDMRHLMAVLA